MNSTFSRTLKALCTVAVVAMLSACGGATSTKDPFIATRVIAFGDGFNQVDANGSGVSTVRTTDTTTNPIVYVTDDTIAGRIASRYGIVVKGVSGVAVGGPALAATGGFSYATAQARVADVDAQITAFLNAAGTVAKKDLIVIAVGNWDIYDATRSGATSMDTVTTALVTSIQRLTNAGAERVVVMPPINMARTPWSTAYVAAHPSTTRLMIQNLSNSAATSFNFTLLAKLTAAYRQDAKPVVFLDRTTDFNSFAGSVDVGGTAIQNYSGLGLTNLATAVCNASGNFAGCDLNSLVDGVGSITYQTSVFADDINLTPAINRYFGDRMSASLISMGWSP
jgi:phospholipase/lecithinase/hemolysin